MIRLILIASLLFNLNLCKKKVQEDSSSSHSNFAIPPNIDVHFGDSTSTISITIKDGISIKHEETTLVGVMLNDKTEYRDKTGNLIFEVDYDVDGDLFLKDEKGNLVWKVRQKPGEYKVSKNEDGSDAFEIKRQSDTNIKILKKDSELSNVVLQDKKIYIENSDQKSFIATDTLILAYGFLFLPDLSPIHKLIFIAEGIHIQ